MYGRILIALEGKETDKTVVTHIKGLAGQMQAEVTLLPVITVADDDGGTGVARQWQLEVGSNGWRRKNQADQRVHRWAA
jgi:nucleotide-binding universal stress UspA family protein